MAQRFFIPLATRLQAPFDTKEQGACHKIGKGAGNKQMIILEQGACKMIKGAFSRGKFLIGTCKQVKEQNHGARGKIKKEPGLDKVLKVARVKQYPTSSSV